MMKKASPLLELTRMRILMFTRDPGALFWVFGFPLVLAFVLGLAFRNRPPDPIHVVVVDAPAVAAVLRKDPALAVEEAPLAEARLRLRRAQVDLVLQLADLGGYLYRYDETR